MFTLKMFESITKNEKALKNYRKGLKAIRGRLIAQASYDKVRTYIPSTFDSMMVDFGRRVERKEFNQIMDEKQEMMVEKVPSNDYDQNKRILDHHAMLVQRCLDANDPKSQQMNSVENELFRKIYA